MVSRAVIQTGAAFFCGAMFGLFVYSFSTHDSQVFQYVGSIPQVASLRDHGNEQSQKHSIPSPHHLDNTSPSNRTSPHDNVSPSNKASSQTDVKGIATTTAAKGLTPSAEMVLILAYMRTGSTLTGDVIQQHKDTFYSFEPFYNIWHGKFSTYMNGTKRKFSLQEEKVEESLRQLKAWYMCDFRQVDLQTLKYLFMEFGTKTIATRTCFQRFKNNFNQTTYEKCIVPLTNRCNNSTVRVIKTIRLSARDIENMLEAFPRMKVIHLVRDPRGILESRIKLRVQNVLHSSISTSSSSLCDTITKDGEEIVYLKSLFPGRFKRIRYEEFAYHPVDTVKSIYKFIGLEPTKTILKYVVSITSSSKNVEKNYNNERKNSVVTSNAWRLKLKKNLTDIIDNSCDDMYRMYGYIAPRSVKELQDVSDTQLWLEDVDY